MDRLTKTARTKLYTIITLVTTVLLAVTLVLTHADLRTSFLSSRASGNDYTLTFNSSNGGNGFGSSYGSGTNSSGTTNSGYSVPITYSNVKKSSGNYCVVANGGYLYNSAHITGLETVTVTFEGTLSILTSTSTTFSGSGTSLTSGSSVDIPAGDEYFKLTASSEATISSIVATYSCVTRVSTSYYEKVMTTNDLEDGDYLIVFEGNSTITPKAFDGSLSTLDATGNTIDVTIEDDKIEANETTNASKFTIEEMTGGYSILSASGYYINRTSGKNGLDASSTASANTISISSGTATVTSTGGKTLAFNTASDQLRFRYIGSYNISLYKLTSSSGGSGGGGDSGGGESGGGESGGGGDVETIFSATITKDNCGLPSGSGSSDAIERSYLLTDDETYLDVVFSAGGYVYNDTAMRLSSSYLEPVEPVILVTKITIDFYSSGQNYIAVTANGSAVTGEASETSGSGVVQDFEINSETWRISSQSGKYAGIYSITIYCEIDTGPKAVTGVSLNKEALSLTNESSESLVATVSPANADNKNVTWVSSNPSVATVDSNGYVQGVAAGSTIITVTTEDGGFTATCTVTVTQIVHVSGVTLNTNALALHTGEDSNLTATVSPVDATNKNVTWISSNTSVVTVSDGQVHAVAKGSASITVTTVDGSKTASCSVTVTDIAVTGVTLDESSITLTKANTKVLQATVSPINATNKNVTWSSNNTAIATVNNGTVTAVKVGTATITVTTEDGGKTASCTVTVNPVAVTGISLNESSLGLYVNGTATLVATVEPSNAEDKTVTWTSSNTSVATVDNGVVTAKATGNATITASCSGFNATCTVTVTTQPVQLDYELVTDASSLSAGQNVIIATSDSIGKALSTTQQSNNRAATSVTISNDTISSSSLSDSVEVFTLETGTASSSWSFKGKDSNYIYAASSGSNYMRSQSSKDANASFSIEIASSGDATILAQGTNTRNKIRYNPNNNSPIFSCYASNSTTGSAPRLYAKASTPISPTNISLPATESMSLIGTKTLDVTYEPSNCNTNKGVTWSSSKPTIASIDSTTGVITPHLAGTTTITATSTYNSNLTDSCELTVTSNMDEWTILMYVCGADLESDTDKGGAATEDLQEIASVSSQPSDVNIVVQAGGASRWESTYSSVINKDKANRFHLRNKSYVKDEQFNKVNMGLSSSLQDFLEWGITNYPAQKIGVILWNHGGAMDGCCLDEQFGDDALTSKEVYDAIKGAREATNYTNKFEFIGYDCCLMQVHDIAGLNAEYAKYQVASEESEWGYGWTYNEWVGNLFAKKSTTNILTEIVDTFASETTAAYTEWQKEDSSYVNDQTLSYLDLSYWDTYQTAWENMATTLSSTSWSTFKTMLNTCQRFGYVKLQSGSYAYAYDVFDIGSCLSKMKTHNTYKNNSTLMTRVSAVEAAYNNLVAYEWHGEGSSGATGLTLMAPVGGWCYQSNYSTGHTPFTTWRNWIISNGSWA